MILENLGIGCPEIFLFVEKKGGYRGEHPLSHNFTAVKYSALYFSARKVLQIPPQYAIISLVKGATYYEQAST